MAPKRKFIVKFFSGNDGVKYYSPKGKDGLRRKQRTFSNLKDAVTFAKTIKQI